jgi:predicted RNase H-like nuclease (RuvC/YqgF family)
MLIEIEEKNQAIVKLEETVESEQEHRQALESEIEQMKQEILSKQQALDMKHQKLLIAAIAADRRLIMRAK